MRVGETAGDGGYTSRDQRFNQSGLVTSSVRHNAADLEQSYRGGQFLV